MREFRLAIVVFFLLFLALFIVAKYAEKQHEKELLKQLPKLNLEEIEYFDVSPYSNENQKYPLYEGKG